MRRVVFLDRDGVINYDSEQYIKSPEEFRLIPKSAEAISHLNQKGWEIIIITNQSAIGRKMISLDILSSIHRKLIASVREKGGQILDILFCPHLPDSGCSCRKPLPGMILEAKNRYDLDLSRTIMIGDRHKDVLCGQNAGCGHTIRVESGLSESCSSVKGAIPDQVFPDLYDAACWILNHLK